MNWLGVGRIKNIFNIYHYLIIKITDLIYQHDWFKPNQIEIKGILIFVRRNSYFAQRLLFIYLLFI